MKAAVTGAYSYSGKYIARRLLQLGEQVVTLTGHPDRPDPFNGRVPAFPLDFSDQPGLIRSLTGVETLYNTYWVRFDLGSNTQARAVENTRILIESARLAGVQRFVHISITNPVIDSDLPYFRGKAANEQAIIQSGISYAILRPTVLFGKEDILINNIAYLLRRFPIFTIPGDGSYRLQPVYVDDLAGLAIEAGYTKGKLCWDAVGPQVFTFEELVHLIASVLGLKRKFLHVPPYTALAAARFLSLFVRDELLTADEVKGLMANLLVSDDPPRCRTSLLDWLQGHRATLGITYASELDRHY